MVFLLFHLGSIGQTKVRFVVNLQQNDSANTTNITVFKWYISHLQLVENNRVVWTEKNSHHLLDAFDTTSLTFTLPTSALLTLIGIRLILMLSDQHFMEQKQH